VTNALSLIRDAKITGGELHKMLTHALVKREASETDQVTVY